MYTLYIPPYVHHLSYTTLGTPPTLHPAATVVYSAFGGG